MPKKFRNRTLLVKPAAAATSYAGSSSRHSADTPPATSVNELIQRSRQTQQRVVNRDVQRHSTPNIGQGSVHPSLQGLIVDATGPLLLRPRTGRRAPGTPLGTPARPRAGPPPPPSWILASANLGTRLERENEQKQLEPTVRPPGVKMPKHGSLTDLILRRIAVEWQAVFDYEQHYICDLSTSMKTLLLIYIAELSPYPMDIHGLQLLYANSSAEEEDEQNEQPGSGSESGTAQGGSSAPPKEPMPFYPRAQIDEDVTHLPLVRCAQNTLSLKALKNFLVLPTPTDDLPSSWDALPPPTSHRFPNLTYLSLSYPSKSSPSRLWAALPPFLHSAVPTITHLSLAGWPVPPDSTMFKLLCRATLCLKWLDVTEAGDDDEAGFLEMLADADWRSAWRGVRTVIVRKSLVGSDVVERLKRKIWQEQHGVARKTLVVAYEGECG
ncbi:hypothetical protein BJ508DRAFT_410301 [Ascobolus immersus RN42]|uniref:Tafazzin n=1 Tax=Ascobolus immersus RN42 TaxID=1160509 RepID=A0A3N4IP63_ASCIM|nr:hypothetical protein BJ508DRAFT_410301 [Ascobolus immersus RN42]